MMLLQAFNRRRRLRAQARALYTGLARAARARAFHEDLGVPDTVDGRFDLIVLHAHLALRRLRAAGESGKALGQALFDTMFQSMDEALRELGVGDLGVGRKIREMTAAFYGRALAYEEALKADDNAALEAALMRNVYRGRPPSGAAVAALARHVRTLDRTLFQSTDEAVLSGAIAWPADIPAPSASVE